MFHKIRDVSPLPEFGLSVQFSEGTTKLYNVSQLFEHIPAFRYFEKHPEMFMDTRVDTGGYGIVWNDGLDLSCEELWENGKTVTYTAASLLVQPRPLPPHPAIRS